MTTTLLDEARTEGTSTSRAIDDQESKYLTFQLADEEYGVEILKVREIIGVMEITAVPQMPIYMKGVINLRGKVIPIIDLRCRFGMERKGHDKHTRIVVVELSRKIVGFVVDAVREVLRIPRSVTEPPPSIGGRVNEEYITGVGKLEDRLLILLDLEKVLGSETVTG